LKVLREERLKINEDKRSIAEKIKKLIDESKK